ncbi:TPA: LOW QUALITY PROTEIN: hypothetical protein N0F65_003941 [Lagenidium giganteum]|uniref:Uncharacterized protein n=1 Tax=Lagenidium giganteum TaxID=4803 RepID=A0AAV2Z791_9STRA|nr:TPA: LOW QUALITY PROTEIN: hypothetical protein N0F65_003941 [Lagenidium giganteum]
MLVPVVISVKVGTIAKSSHTNVPDDQGTFESFVVAVEERVSASLAAYEMRTIRADRSLYLKPSKHATQSQLLPLSDDTFRQCVAVALSNHGKRKKDTAPCTIEVFAFAFAARETSADTTSIRRATVPRVQHAARSIDEYLQESGDIRFGNMARTHWAISQARQADRTPMELPTTATFRQLQHLDEMGENLAASETDTSEFRVITARIHGSPDLQLSINLRPALGLPSYSLVADGIFHSFVPPGVPTEAYDIDRMGDSS